MGGENITREVCSALAGLCEEELQRAEAEQVLLMEAEQRQTGGERKWLPYGRVRMKVCPEVFNFWATKLGVECWQDREFIDWMEKRFGDLVAIKSKPGVQTIAT